jgi:hypothetical protein
MNARLCAVLLWLLPHIPFVVTRALIEAAAEGFLTCQGDPLANITVQLYDTNGTLVAMESSDRRGYFSFDLSARQPLGPKPAIQVSYRYIYDLHNSFVVTNSLKVVRSERFILNQTAAADGRVRFGTIALKPKYCNPFDQFRLALNEFRETAQRPHPQKVLYIIADAWVATRLLPIISVPFASTNTIRLPRQSPGALTLHTARHELGHTIRHTLDGPYPHFLWDVLRFRYVRSHWCSLRTNTGMAFNEGWAEFWATNSQEPGCIGFNGTSPEIEGRVTRELQKLAIRCHTDLTEGKRAFLDVLTENPKKIHSYAEFATAHKDKYGCW